LQLATNAAAAAAAAAAADVGTGSDALAKWSSLVLFAVVASGTVALGAKSVVVG